MAKSCQAARPHNTPKDAVIHIVAAVEDRALPGRLFRDVGSHPHLKTQHL
jgi:hypothetical protein